MALPEQRRATPMEMAFDKNESSTTLKNVRTNPISLSRRFAVKSIFRNELWRISQPTKSEGPDRTNPICRARARGATFARLFPNGATRHPGPLPGGRRSRNSQSVGVREKTTPPFAKKCPNEPNFPKRGLLKKPTPTTICMTENSDQTNPIRRRSASAEGVSPGRGDRVCWGRGAGLRRSGWNLQLRRREDA